MITSNLLSRAKTPLKVLLLLSLTALASIPSAWAQPSGNPPERVAYQGFLTDNTGTPLATNGTRNFNLLLKLYDASSGGNTLWAEAQTATVDRGNVSLLLGDGTTFSPYAHSLLAVFATNSTASDRYLEVTIRGIGAGGADVTMTPRLRLVTNPFSFLATFANNLANASGSNILSSTGGNLTANANMTINGTTTLNGNLTVNGGVTASQNSSFNGALIGNGVATGFYYDGNIALRSGGGTYFQSANGASTWMSVQSGGLNINGSLTAAGSVVGAGLYGNNSVWNQLKDTAGNYQPWYLRNSDTWDYLDSCGKGLQFRTPAHVAAMILAANGNIGIGTTAPAYMLDVAGAGNFGGALIGYGVAKGFYWDSASQIAFRNNGGTFWQNEGGTSTKMYLDSSGRLGIGTLSPAQALDVNGWIQTELDCGLQSVSSCRSSPSYAQFVNYGGAIKLNLYNGSNMGANVWRTASYDGDSNWDFYSDRRLKKDIASAEPMLDNLMKVNFVRYHWNEDASTNTLKFGVIAQELQPIFPLMVKTGVEPNCKEERFTVAYTEFATVACKSIQELKIRTDAQLAEKDAKIKALEVKVARLVELERKSVKLEQMEAEMAALKKIVARLAEQGTRPKSTQASLIINEN